MLVEGPSPSTHIRSRFPLHPSLSAVDGASIEGKGEIKRIGDSVVVFAQGPIGLCATAGAKLMGASMIIGVDSDEIRLNMSQRLGADVTLNPLEVDVVEG